MWDIGLHGICCRTTRFMQLWFTCLFYNFKTAYNKLWTTIYGQCTQQIGIIKQKFKGSLITYSDLLLDKDMHSSKRSGRNGLRMIQTQGFV